MGTQTSFRFGRGEGAVAVILKKEEDALRDGDHIYGVVCTECMHEGRLNNISFVQIKGTALQTTGSSSSLHSPSGITQANCIRAAYEDAGLSLSDVDFVELHATGS